MKGGPKIAKGGEPGAEGKIVKGRQQVGYIVVLYFVSATLKDM